MHTNSIVFDCLSVTSRPTTPNHMYRPLDCYSPLMGMVLMLGVLVVTRMGPRLVRYALGTPPSV